MHGIGYKASIHMLQFFTFTSNRFPEISGNILTLLSYIQYDLWTIFVSDNHWLCHFFNYCSRSIAAYNDTFDPIQLRH